MTQQRSPTGHRASKYLKADLFTIVYFVSEIFKFNKEVEPFLGSLFDGAKEGAMFLYLDNDNSQFDSWYDKLTKRHGLKQIEAENCIMRTRTDEEKIDLAEYYNKFAKSASPKLNSKTAYRIHLKPRRS